MEHLKISGIKNKSNDYIRSFLTEKRRDCIAEFMAEHEEELKNSNFNVFVDEEFLYALGKDKVHMFTKMLLDISE